ncbi:MAG: HaeIII family restriction endonuclease [Bacteroidetes bacterium]|nr:HaeIII family restriction endonuclease [Bacteroidota bacterium]
MPTQTEAGKAFEFALLIQFFNHLNGVCNIRISKDESYQNALECFDLFSSSSQNKYLKAADAAVHHILELEPRLADPINENDTLVLEIAPDSAGIRGDVRDILFLRSSQNWEIGISAKNNHKAVKHSRLSENIDFGREWVNIPCSQNYFSKVIDLPPRQKRLL